MTSNTRFWAPFAAYFILGFAVASIAILALSLRAEGQTVSRDKAAVASLSTTSGPASRLASDLLTHPDHLQHKELVP